MNRAPFGFRSCLTYTPEMESNLSGLPLSDVLTDRARALEVRQTWAEARARDMLALAVADMDRLGSVPLDFERREDPESVRVGSWSARRWRDSDDAESARLTAWEASGHDY